MARRKTVDFADIKKGTEFRYRGQYYIKDQEGISVQLTGKNAGEVKDLSGILQVIPVTLLVEEER